jgi:hypothetical protein
MFIVWDLLREVGNLSHQQVLSTSIYSIFTTHSENTGGSVK